jgi:5-epi-alpha-selinene synthase
MSGTVPEPERAPIEDLIWSTIHCPFALKLNEHIDLLGPHTEAWLLESGLLASRTDYQPFDRLNLPWITAAVYADCDPDGLKIASDWITMFLLWDDICGRADPGTEIEQLARHAETIRRVLYGQHAARVDDIPYVCALDALRTRTLAFGGGGLYLRFAADVDAFVTGCVTEVIQRCAGIVLDLEAHLQLRRDTGATYPMMELIELVHRMELPPDVLASGHLSTMMRMASHHVNLVNDLFSLYPEIQDHDSHNLVLVLHRQGLSVEAAVRQVIDDCNRSVERFLQAEAGLPSFGPEVDPLVARYVAGLKCFLSGHLHWYAHTDRYQVDAPDGPTVVAW